MIRELAAFFVHLRWHYQLLILPAGYLLGGLYRTDLSWRSFAIQFFNVHLLLNGGVTAYNSYHDDDDGPIGGIEHPPKMAQWMLPASIALQIVGLAIAIAVRVPGVVLFCALWCATMVLSIAYSRRPRPRWKGHPVLAFIAVGIGTGTNTFLLGYLAGGPGGGGPGSIAPGLSTPGLSTPGLGVEPIVVVAAFGVALLLLAMYPISQVFQLEADASRNDRTFATAYGLAGVRRFFLAAYSAGLAIVSFTLEQRHEHLGKLFLASGGIGGLAVWLQLRALTGVAAEYRRVMRMKYVASLTFTLFISGMLVFTSANR